MQNSIHIFKKNSEKEPFQQNIALGLVYQGLQSTEFFFKINFVGYKVDVLNVWSFVLSTFFSFVYP